MGLGFLLISMYCLRKEQLPDPISILQDSIGSIIAGVFLSFLHPLLSNDILIVGVEETYSPCQG